MLERFELNAGTGMTIGIAIASLVGILASLITGDDSVWAWIIPVGIASGLAIGAGRQRERERKQ